MEETTACRWQPIVERLLLQFPTVDVAQIAGRVQATWALFDGDATSEESRLRAVEWMVRSELEGDVRT
jgi:hypothetical protein